MGTQSVQHNTTYKRDDLSVFPAMEGLTVRTHKIEGCKNRRVDNKLTD